MTAAEEFLDRCVRTTERTGIDPGPNDVIWAAKMQDDEVQINFNDDTGLLKIKFSDGSDLELQGERVH